MRALAWIGLGCATLLIAAYAYSTRNVGQALNAASRSEPRRAMEAARDDASLAAHGPASDNADELSSDAAVETPSSSARAEVAPLDPASARVPSGRIHIHARVVEDLPFDTPRGTLPRAIEDQVAIAALHGRGTHACLSSHAATTRAGEAFFDVPDPGVRPLRIQLSLAERVVAGRLFARHTFERPDQRAIENWTIEVKPRRFLSLVAQDLLGRPIADLALDVGFHRYAAAGENASLAHSTARTDGDGRCLLPACRDNEWGYSAHSLDWIVLGSRPAARERERCVVLARRASIDVVGLPQFDVQHRRVGVDSGLEPSESADVTSEESARTAGSKRAAEVVFLLVEHELARLELEPVAQELLGNSRRTSPSGTFRADELPAGVRLNAFVDAATGRDRAIAMTAVGEREFAGVIRGVRSAALLQFRKLAPGSRALVLEPGRSMLSLRVDETPDASPALESLASSTDGQMFTSWKTTRATAFAVRPRFEEGIHGRCSISIRPSAHNANGRYTVMYGTVTKDGNHVFALPFAGPWDVRVDVSKPRPHEQYVYGHEVDDTPLEIEIELRNSARVRFVHADGGVRGGEHVLDWQVVPDAQAPLANGPGATWTLSANSELTTDRNAAANTNPDVTWDTQQRTRSLRKGQLELELPSGVPIEFDFSGVDAAGYVYRPQHLGPLTFSAGACEIAIPDSLTGNVELELVSHAVASNASEARIVDASGHAMWIAVGSLRGAGFSVPLGGIGSTRVRSVPPGDATVVVRHHDGTESRHAVHVERGATTRLTLGER